MADVEIHHGHIAWIVVFIIIIVLAIVYTGYNFLAPLKLHATTISTTTINSASLTSTTTTVYNYSNPQSPCSKFDFIGQQLNTTYSAKCLSSGGVLGLWVGAGIGGIEHVRITGNDGKVYVNQTSRYNCTTFFQNFTGPAQLYTIKFTTGTGGGSCGNPNVIINTTTVPPKVIYNYIYNGDFGNGEYTGWNETYAGFGAAPLNITASADSRCYQGSPWSNYNGIYFATTYNCGISVAPGNLTSSPFIVNPQKPFLNFKLISPQDDSIYIELLKANYALKNGQELFSNSTPLVIAHFNTYNLSVSLNSTSTFANVTIPLTPYINQALRVRIVAASQNNYVAAGDFVLANRPLQEKGIAVNITNAR